MDNNLKSALCYVPFVGFIISLVFFFTEKEDKTLRFNALQGFLLSLALDVISWLIAWFVPFYFISWIFYLLTIAIGIIMFLKTYKGEEIVLPVIGPFAKEKA